jgi:predicted nucleic acid-binding protein
MIVISDTTPLISLMKIGQLNLVYRMFGEIQIPEAVFKELVSNKRFSEESRQIRESSFIKTVQVMDVKAVDLLRRSTGLDIGESEAIILSDSMKANLLLMDEVRGRSVAQQMGIQLMGTVGMLMAAYKEELLSKDEILNCIDILKNNGRHISGKLYDQLIQKLEVQ